MAVTEVKDTIPALEPRIIKGSRGKSSLYLVGSLIFVLIGSQMVEDAKANNGVGWLCITFFSLCTLVSAWLIIRPQVLLLDGEGFSLDGGLVRSAKKIGWRDVQGFFVYRLPRGGKMIGYNYDPTAGNDSWLIGINRGFGAEGALPKGWSGSPERMAEELNDYRQQALSRMD
jgi:hypothetical protein